MQKNSDKELLKLAAKAARMQWIDDQKFGLTIQRNEGGMPYNFHWNPELDGSDAMHLARVVGLRIDFNFRTGSDKRLGVGVWTPDDAASYPPFWTMYGKNPDFDAWSTIVRAAAHVGKAMP